MLDREPVTREQLRRAAVAGAFAGFVAPPVLGAVIGAAVFPLGGLFAGALVGAYVSIPEAIFSGIASRSLAIALVKARASTRTARVRFRALGTSLAAVTCAPGVALIIDDGADRPDLNLIGSGIDGGDYVWVFLVIVLALVGGGVTGTWSGNTRRAPPSIGATPRSDPVDEPRRQRALRSRIRPRPLVTAARARRSSGSVVTM